MAAGGLGLQHSGPSRWFQNLMTGHHSNYSFSNCFYQQSVLPVLVGVCVAYLFLRKDFSRCRINKAVVSEECSFETLNLDSKRFGLSEGRRIAVYEKERPCCWINGNAKLIVRSGKVLTKYAYNLPPLKHRLYSSGSVRRQKLNRCCAVIFLCKLAQPCLRIHLI